MVIHRTIFRKGKYEGFLETVAETCLFAYFKIKKVFVNYLCLKNRMTAKTLLSRVKHSRKNQLSLSLCPVGGAIGRFLQHGSPGHFLLPCCSFTMAIPSSTWRHKPFLGPYLQVYPYSPIFSGLQEAPTSYQEHLYPLLQTTESRKKNKSRMEK